MGVYSMSETEAPRRNDRHFLDFEMPIVELEQKITALQRASEAGQMNLDAEIVRLREKCDTLTREIFRKLTPWQIVALARHGQRPHLRDYIRHLCTEFEELHGDRAFADDAALVGGLARFRGRTVMILGHDKGRSVEQHIACNYGMPKPEGYRKARRLMRLAAHFKLPILSFIDSAGAYPGVDAEERGQHEAIAGNLACMATLPVPIIATIIGEGGSGGALAIALADLVCMQHYAIYSVISPEGCAAILWRDAAKAELAAGRLGLTADALQKHGFIDRIIEEPGGGAHRDPAQAARMLGDAIAEAMDSIRDLDDTARLQARRQRFLAFGTKTAPAG